MRLINVNTLRLEEFIGDEVPKYAILSHRWTNEELNYKDVAKQRINTNSLGYAKLVEASRVTRDDYSLEYLWIDTCCIDKRSSAELSEAINSMFEWYKGAEVCLAYLQDRSLELENSFNESEWWTRSWTLQELLAPEYVVFYDRDWSYVGDRKSHGSAIAKLTGIPKDVLKGTRDITDCPVAQRMSWAAKRNATRTEDVAYSLLGIFGIHMPLLYGEGERAFARLQEEIISQSCDPTFLVWGHGTWVNELLANHPRDFADTGADNVFPASSIVPFRLTNTGLDIEGTLIRWQPGIYGFVLGVGRLGTYVLLIRDYASLDNAMVKIGVTSLSTGMYEVGFPHWCAKRKIHLVRRTPKQRLQSIRWNTPTDFVLKVLTEEQLSVTPIGMRYGGPGNLWWEEPWEDADNLHWEDADSLRCDFVRPMKPMSARIKLAGQEQALFVDLCYDFDSRPCALFHMGACQRHVWDISDSTGPNKRVPDRNHREHYLTKVAGEGSQDGSLFLRASETAIYARVPTGQGCESSLWVSFLPAYHQGNQSPHWAFMLSTMPI